MPVHFDKSKRRWRYSLTRVVAGKRIRADRLLPKSWDRAQAEAFDEAETGRLVAIASGTSQERHLIELAVALYLQDKAAELKSHRRTSEHFAACYWAYEGRYMDELSQVATDYAKQETGRIAPATIRNRLALLRAACRYAWKHHGLGEADPATRMRLPTVRNERHRYVTRAEMLAIARACRHPTARALIRIAFYSGMRRSEIWHAKVMNGGFVLTDTKNNSRRIVPLHPKIATAIKFLPPVIAYRTLHLYYTEACATAGIAGITFHDLRHSAASEMINAGVDLYTVGRVLGHKDARSTGRYAHLATDSMAVAVRKIGKNKT